MDEHQIHVPPSFIALFVPPGRIKPVLPRETILERYEFCEDLSQLLSEHARQQLLQLGIDVSDALQRVARGLSGIDGLDEAQAGWVLTRTEELLRG